MRERQLKALSLALLLSRGVAFRAEMILTACQFENQQPKKNERATADGCQEASINWPATART